MGNNLAPVDQQTYEMVKLIDKYDQPDLRRTDIETAFQKEHPEIKYAKVRQIFENAKELYYQVLEGRTRESMRGRQYNLGTISITAYRDAKHALVAKKRGQPPTYGVGTSVPRTQRGERAATPRVMTVTNEAALFQKLVPTMKKAARSGALSGTAAVVVTFTRNTDGTYSVSKIRGKGDNDKGGADAMLIALQGRKYQVGTLKDSGPKTFSVTYQLAEGYKITHKIGGM